MERTSYTTGLLQTMIKYAEYMIMLARGEYRDDIAAFAPNDMAMSQATGKIQADRRKL